MILGSDWGILNYTNITGGYSILYTCCYLLQEWIMQFFIVCVFFFLGSAVKRTRKCYALCNSAGVCYYCFTTKIICQSRILMRKWIYIVIFSLWGIWCCMRRMKAVLALLFILSFSSNHWSSCFHRQQWQHSLPLYMNWRIHPLLLKSRSVAWLTGFLHLYTLLDLPWNETDYKWHSEPLATLGLV